MASGSIATTPQPSQMALGADAFVDSIGVNTHFNYDDTYYSTQYAAVSNLLIQSGIRHIRDGGPGQSQQYYDRLNALYQVAQIRNIGGPGPMNPDQLPLALQQMISSMPHLEGIESVNEWDLNGGSSWASYLQTYQPALYQAAKANLNTSQLPVIGPSLVMFESAQKVGDLNSYLDYGNLHNYYAGFNPGSPGWGDLFGGFGYGSIGYSLALARLVCVTKPVWTTETGYATGTPTSGTPDSINARYLPRMLLKQFQAGIKRTYIYQFADMGPSFSDSPLSLIDGNQQAKPSYTILKNLIALLSDRGSQFTPGSLNMTLTGGDSNVEHMLLQKRDGSFFLVLWIETPGFDLNTLTPMIVPSQNLALTLTSGASSISISNFADDGSVITAQPTFNLSKLNLTVTDHVQIIHIVP